ncbi:unnamed protein product [Rotaria sp. Silwood2]|nr:unnamed protein product [Rotaria sp. Silwood2]CAF4508106.1 unnamed protein product [Rotaria sp. Silwood2]
MDDMTLTLQNAQHFCTLVSNRLPNLKIISFIIHDSYEQWSWKPLRIVDGKNKSTKRIVNLIYFLVDHLQQLVSLQITFLSMKLSIKIIDNQQIMFQGIKPVMLTHFGLTNPKLLPTLNTFYLKYFDGVSHEGDEDEDNDSDKE